MPLQQSTVEFHSRLLKLSRRPQTVTEYCESIMRVEPVNESPPVRDAISRAVQALSAEALGEFAGDVGDLVGRAGTVVSFAEHHSSLAHPLTMSSVAAQALYATLSGARLITLTCGSVPLDNELFPRGIIVGGRKVPFQSSRHRHRTPLRCPPLDCASFGRNLHRAYGDGAFDRRSFRALVSWWDRLGPELAEAGEFWRQITVLNRRLFEALFAVDVPAPVMIPVELVAQRVLLDDLAQQRETWLERCMFQPDARSALLDALDGIRCFWHRSPGRGTFLFWHLDDEDRLVRLMPDGDLLVSDGGEVHGRLEPAALRDGIATGRLIPAASYALLRLLFQARMRTFGGPLQYDYVGNARRRLLTGLRDCLDPAELDAIAAVPLSYYVNFADKKELHGELLRIVDPVGPDSLASIGAQRLDALAAEDLTWVDRELAHY